jgi:hypothetical protein
MMDLTARILVIDDTRGKRGFSRRCSRRVMQGRPRAAPVTSPLALHPDHSRLNIHLRIDGQHILHWGHGGKTDLENLVLLCHRHHWSVHEGGWQLVRTEQRRVLAILPSHTHRSWTRAPDGSLPG